MNNLDFIAIIISILSFGFSILVYYRHDKKIKTLEREKLEREASENKRAKFNVQYIWFVNGTLLLQNIGKSTANNIKITIKSETPTTFQDGTTQYYINRLEETEKSEPIQLIGEYQQKIRVSITWDDDSGIGMTKNILVENQDGNGFMGK